MGLKRAGLGGHLGMERKFSKPGRIFPGWDLAVVSVRAGALIACSQRFDISWDSRFYKSNAKPWNSLRDVPGQNLRKLIPGRDRDFTFEPVCPSYLESPAWRVPTPSRDGAGAITEGKGGGGEK